jgi:ATP-dependent helicase/nuclease subunit B
MRSVVTGPFHPHLESALVEHIQRVKAADPWARVAILVPSRQLLDRLRTLLALDQGLALFNLHLLTFHQLALRLADEQRGRSSHILPRIVDELFFEQLVRHFVQLESAPPALRQLGRSFGTWAALWSTVRDLKDGGIDPATALQGLEEGCFELDEKDWLHALFSLHSAVERFAEQLNVGTADDLAKALLPAVDTSAFVGSLAHVCYYGFYDLTQVQLSLFQAISDRAPTTLFFPAGKDPSFAFARRFFDRYVQPLIRSSNAHRDLEAANERAASTVDRTIHSVIGSEEELSLTCRTMLDLVETHGYQFDEIGVVARTLDPYRTVLQVVFDRYCVPFATSAQRQLIHEPLCKALLQLAALPVDDFYRSTVLELVTSPFYAVPVLSDRSERPAGYRPEQWKAVLDALHITHGLDEWKRLEPSSRSALELNGDSDEAGAIGPVKVAPDVIALMWKTVSHLLASCAELPAQGTIAALVEAFQRLVEKHFHRQEEDVGASTPVSTLPSLWSAIDRTLLSLTQLDAIGEEVSWAAFAELLTHALERATIPTEPASHRGVMVLDAMAARGVPFRALFVLGLNEKVFPRFIREDAFLRDRHRRVLETTLGFKIDEKLAGYDEERLLFGLVCQAAGSRLYLSFQRADDAGRMLAASPYLPADLLRGGHPAHAVDIVPRRLSDRMAQRPTISRFLPPGDLAQWMAGNGQDPAGLLEAAGRDAVLLRHGVQALSRMEDDLPALTPYDGMTGFLETHWARIEARGIAPTPLERYARCPFLYFSADVLKLEPVRMPSSDEPDARVLGTVCHAALRRCYQYLLPAGWPAKPVTDDTVDWCIETAVEEAAREYETLHRTGHYLLWELAKTDIVDAVTAVVDDDGRAYSTRAFEPIAFEVDAEGTLNDVPVNAAGLKVRGRIDRVDRHQDSGALRIIDYKLKMGKSLKSEDRNLLQSAVRGYRLQPPLYTQLNVPGHGKAQEVQLLFLSPHGSVPVTRSAFDSAIWSGDNGTLIRNTLSQLVDGLQHGRFFIVPNGYCETCEYRVACRREHMPSWLRATRAVEAKALMRLRSLRVDHE